MKQRKTILYLLSAAALLIGTFTAMEVSHAQHDSLHARGKSQSNSHAFKARVGKKAPNFKLVDQFGKKHQLKDYRGKTVVLEWVNPNCPFVVRHYKTGTTVNIEKRFNGKISKGNDLVWLRINSTSADHRDFMSAKETQSWAKKNGVTGPVLDDSDGKVGHLYGAKSTPNVFVIDKSGKLIFSGAMDDDPYGNKKPEMRHNYIDGILTAWSEGNKVKPFANDSYGCSIKYSKH